MTQDEPAVLRAVDEAVAWVLKAGYGNVLVETTNETNDRDYDHGILRPARVTELIERVKRTSVGGRRLLGP